MAGGASGTAWIYDTRTGGFITKLSVWRSTPGPDGQRTLQKWLDFTGTAFPYTTGYNAGYNADGIQATPCGRSPIVGSLNTGKLWLIDIATKADTNTQIVKLNLSDDWTSSTVDTVTTSPRFDSTVALAADGSRLLVLRRAHRRCRSR